MVEWIWRIVTGIIHLLAFCYQAVPMGFVKLEVLVTRNDEFEFGGDGSEHFKSVFEVRETADFGEVAAVKEDVGLGGGKL